MEFSFPQTVDCAFILARKEGGIVYLEAADHIDEERMAYLVEALVGSQQRYHQENTNNVILDQRALPICKGISLGGNAIDGQLVSELASAIAQHPVPFFLGINENRIGDVGARLLANQCIAPPFTALQSLSVANCAIGTEGMVALFAALGNNSSLQLFNIGGNKVEAQAVSVLSASLARNTSLVDLIMDRTNLNDEGARLLAEGLMANHTVESLAVPHCRIGNDGLGHLSRVMEWNPVLHSYNLSNNRIGDEGLRHLARAVRVCTHPWDDQRPYQLHVILYRQRSRFRAESVRGVISACAQNTESFAYVEFDRREGVTELRDQAFLLHRREREARTAISNNTVALWPSILAYLLYRHRDSGNVNLSIAYRQLVRYPDLFYYRPRFWNADAHENTLQHSDAATEVSGSERQFVGENSSQE